MNQYVGHPLQTCGVEEMRLCDGKADGMRILRVRNNKGLEFEISLDRCGDISRLSLKGDNFCFFSPTGYVSPKYYDNQGAGFLKSFTAGFLTTCGLTQVGPPCEDGGEALPLHGNISHVPCENFAHWIEDGKIHIRLSVRDASIFSHHLLLEREYICVLEENILQINDRIRNIGPREVPLEILYHFNMGYPLLSEKAIVTIPTEDVVPSDEPSAKGFADRLKMEKPQPDFAEQCFFYHLEGKPIVSIYNPEIEKGLEMTFDTAELSCFTEWKMMGAYEYVLGLEPGNCNPIGRVATREAGKLETLAPQQEKQVHIAFAFKG